MGVGGDLCGAFMHVGLLVALIKFLGGIFLMLMLLSCQMGLGQKSSVKHFCFEVSSADGLFFRRVRTLDFLCGRSMAQVTVLSGKWSSVGWFRTCLTVDTMGGGKGGEGQQGQYY